MLVLDVVQVPSGCITPTCTPLVTGLLSDSTLQFRTVTIFAIFDKALPCYSCQRYSEAIISQVRDVILRPAKPCLTRLKPSCIYMYRQA